MLDTIFMSAIIFIMSFILLFRHLKNAILCFFICNIIAIIAFIILFKISLKKHKLNNLNNKDLKLSEKCFNTIKFLDKKNYNNYFENLLSSKQISEKIFFNGTLYFYIETRTELSEQDFYLAYDYFQINNLKHPICFICLSASKNVIELINTSPITFELYTANDLFLLMKHLNNFPFENISTNQKNKFKHIYKFKNKFLTSITRNHFKDFFISGLSLITLSLFIPYSKYYLVFGIILLTFSVISLFIKNKAPDIKTKSPLTEIAKKNDT